MWKYIIRLSLMGGMGIMMNLYADTDSAPYRFDGTISREVLERYLARSVTAMDLLTGVGNVEDNLRMIQSIGVKYAGRTIYLWASESQLPGKLARAKEIEPRLHALDPEMILQAGLFEIVTTDVNHIAIPSWVFEAFQLKPEDRSFRYDAMLFPDGRMKDHWEKNASVPDITRLETRLWFYFLGRSYIDVGCEALHIGQVALIGNTDKDNSHWWDVLSRIRAYAKQHARRHLVLIDAHVPDGGPLYDGDKLLLDVHAFPLRIAEVKDKPLDGVLQMGYIDSIYGRSKGGITPSGWRCEHLPYLVELDNWGVSGKEGKAIGSCWIWGYDEIDWFAHQPESYRNEWLRYAWKWLKEHDPNGHLQMPLSRCIHVPIPQQGKPPIAWYFANRPSEAVPTGFNQEDAIKAIWAEDK